MKIINISNLKFNIKQNLASFKKENVTSSISNANNFDLYDRALSNYNQINFMGRISISKEELQDYILEHPNENQRKIGEHFGVVPSTIRNLIEKYEIEYTTKPHATMKSSCVSKEKLEKYIKEHPEANLTAIGKYFGVTYALISKKIKEYGIEYHPHVKPISVSEKELREYMENNPDENQKEIAKHFKVTTSTIGKLIRMYDIDYHSHNSIVTISKDELEKYIIDHPQENQIEIANYFGITTSGLFYLIKKYGIEYKIHNKSGGISKKELKKFIFEHPKSGKNEMALYFEQPKSMIDSLLKKYNLKAYITDKEVIEYASKHPQTTINHIAKYFDISIEEARSLVKRFACVQEKKEHISEMILRKYIYEHPEQNQTDLARYFHVSVSEIFSLIQQYGIELKN